MKRILLFLLALTVMLSACVSVGPTSCVEDNICSIDEKFRGGCNDCKPDFSFSDDDISLYYDPLNEVVELFACVKNTGGEFIGEVPVSLGLSTNRQDVYDEYETWLYFNEDEAQGDLGIDVREGEIMLNGYFRVATGDNEQYSCFGYQFENVEEGSRYDVRVKINSDASVSERDYENNYGYSYLEGTPQFYPDVLFEYNLGDFTYLRSNGWFRENYESYSAIYDRGLSDSVHVHLAKTPSATQNLRSVEDQVRSEVYYELYDEWDSDLYYNLDISPYLVSRGNQKVYVVEKSYVTTLVWPFEGGHIAVFDFSQEGQSNVVYDTYYNKYRSVISGGDTGNETDVFLELGVPVTIQQNGRTYEVEIVGANTDADNGRGSIFLSVNGLQDSFFEGESKNINGLQITAVDLFVTDIPVTASANLLIESGDSDVIEYDAKIVLGTDVTMDYGFPGNEDFAIEFADVSSNDGIFDLVLTTDKQELTVGDEMYIESDFMYSDYAIIEASPASGIAMMSSAGIAFLTVGAPVTLEHEGKTYDVEIIVGDGVSNAIISVNGVRETIFDGEAEVIGGLNIYVKDLFLTNIPETSASAQIYFGDELYISVPSLITDSCAGDNAIFDTVETNGEEVETVEACVQYDDANGFEVSEMRFRYIPSNDRDDFIGLGKRITMPIFDIDVALSSQSQAVTGDEEQSLIEFQLAGNDLEFRATNAIGNEYQLDLVDNQVTGVVSDGSMGEDLISKDDIVEGRIFLVNSIEDTVIVSRFVEVVDIDLGNDEVILEDLATGVETVFNEGDFIFNSNISIDSIDTNAFDLSSESAIVFHAAHNTQIGLYQDDGREEFSSEILWSEGDDNLRFSFGFEYSSGKEEVVLVAGVIESDVYGVISPQSDDDDWNRALTYGGYFMQYDADDRDGFELWTRSEAGDYDLTIVSRTCQLQWTTQLYQTFNGVARSNCGQ